MRNATVDTVKKSTAAMSLTWLSMKIAFGFIIQRNCKSSCVKSLDLLATIRLWPESGTHAMGCGAEVLATRKVEVAGITAAPSGVWMTQIARNLTDVAIGFLSDHRYLICDRDPLYAREFRETLRAAGSRRSACRRGAPTSYGSIIQPNCKSHCVKSLDLPAAGRLWPESGRYGMGCGDEVHTALKLLTHHDFGLG